MSTGRHLLRVPLGGGTLKEFATTEIVSSASFHSGAGTACTKHLSWLSRRRGDGAELGPRGQETILCPHAVPFKASTRRRGLKRAGRRSVSRRARGRGRAADSISRTPDPEPSPKTPLKGDRPRSSSGLWELWEARGPGWPAHSVDLREESRCRQTVIRRVRLHLPKVGHLRLEVPYPFQRGLHLLVSADHRSSDRSSSRRAGRPHNSPAVSALWLPKARLPPQR